MNPAISPLPRLIFALAAFAAAPLAAQTPTPVPAVINPPGGGTIVTATPAPTSIPAVIQPTDGGTIVTATPTPTPAAVTTLAAAALVHERRLVRDVQNNTDNIKSKGNFGAQLWLINDADFFLNWRKPETPAIRPVEIAVRGQALYTAIVFYGAGRDDKGLSNVSYDITVRRPDNSVYTLSRDLVGFQNLGATDDKQLYLGRNYVSINIGPADPAGLYTVETNVHDNIGRTELPLVQHFVVQPN